MPYWQLFYHLVWTTKNRDPLILPDVESIIYDLLRTKAIGLGATVFAIGGMPDHVHVVASIPPKIAVAKFVGQIKAVAATKFNKMDLPYVLYWQQEYGAFSFDGKRLPNVIAYVQQQKEHHANQTTIPVLERHKGQTKWLLREPGPVYAVDDKTWRAELASLVKD